MAALFEFDLAGITHRVVITNRHHIYMLVDGTSLPILSCPAWCGRCQRFVEAERVPSGHSLQQQIDELEAFAVRPGLIPPQCVVRIGELPELRRRLEWRSNRIALPKCLSCESTDVVLVWRDGNAMIPSRGQCIARFRGWIDAVTDLPIRYYTTEGDQIVGGTQGPRGR